MYSLFSERQSLLSPGGLAVVAPSGRIACPIPSPSYQLSLVLTRSPPRTTTLYWPFTVETTAEAFAADHHPFRHSLIPTRGHILSRTACPWEVTTCAPSTSFQTEASFSSYFCFCVPWTNLNLCMFLFVAFGGRRTQGQRCRPFHLSWCHVSAPSR